MVVVAVGVVVVGCNLVTGDDFDVSLVDGGAVPTRDAATDAAGGNDGSGDASDAAGTGEGGEAGDAAGDAAAADAADAAPLAMISARAATTCGVTGGAVECWGTDDDDQLGADDTDSSARSTATTVAGLTAGVLSVSVGTSHACALRGGGVVECWGSNAAGQLGSDAGAGPYASPSPVALPRKAIAVAAGEASSCAILDDGSVVCWGDNASGELGAGDSAPAMSLAPLAVSGLSAAATSIAAGELHVCVVLVDTTVACWGWNHYGQIGDNALDDRHAAYVIPDLTGVTAVAAGDQHTCVLTSGGAVYCWGANDSGQLGDGTTTARMIVNPALAAFQGGVTAIAAGSLHNCAVVAAGGVTDGVHCWGADSEGQLGNGNQTGIDDDPAADPPVGFLGTSIVSLAAGGNHSCAVIADGSAWCWGENTEGQIGNGGSMDDVAYPTKVTGWP